MIDSGACDWCGVCDLRARAARIGVAEPTPSQRPFVDTDLDTLATALYVTCDDLLVIRPEHAPYRPESGFEPAITDAELITLAVMSALLGYTSERRWLRYAHQNLRAMFPALPGQSGYNKRLRKLAPTIAWLIGVLVADTSVGDDDLWVVDSTPVECARSTETVKRSDLAGWAQYGYCASHSRLLLGSAAASAVHRARTAPGVGVDRGQSRRTRRVDRDPLHHIDSRVKHQGIGDDHRRQELLRPRLRGHPGRPGHHLAPTSPQGQTPSPGHRFFKPLRQIIESVNDTLKGQLDLEHHQGRTIAGVCTRIGQRILALTAAICHNDRIGHTIRRSLTPYDH